MDFKRAVVQVLPPILTDAIRIWRGGRLRFSGHYSDWKVAKAASLGYDDAALFGKVLTGTREVVAGRAIFERDGVLFFNKNLPFQLLSGVLLAAASNEGNLDVVDFGGALGSTYRQLRPMLHGLSSVHWRVVEQPHYVEAGIAEFTTAELQFYPSLSSLPSLSDGSIGLLSSVIQYIPDPKDLLAAIQQLNVQYLMIDRVPISEARSNQLSIQHVPRQIYRASYPVWILSRSWLDEQLGRRWKEVASYQCEEGRYRTSGGLDFSFRGMLLERIP